MSNLFIDKQVIENNYSEDVIKDNFTKITINDDSMYISNNDLKPFVNRITKKVSMEELRFAMALEMKGIEYSYQPPKLTLHNGLKTAYADNKPITYTPDFLIVYNGRNILVEIKGFIPLLASFKYKIYDILINENLRDAEDKPLYEYYIAKWIGSKRNNDLELYLYNQSVSKTALKSAKNRTKNNFWTLVGIK